MRTLNTDYGVVKVGSQQELFDEALRIALEQFRSLSSDRYTWALTGGSTPKVFYRYVAENGLLPADILEGIVWTTSDERFVPLASDDSNFGNAERLMLDPLDVPASARAPWPTEGEAADCAAAYAETLGAYSSDGSTYDVCFVGMGDDCHTLSLFPGSALLTDPVDADYGAVDVPGKGWRLTLTPKGLLGCGKVVMMTLGAGKAEALRDVLQGDFDPIAKPSQNLKSVAERATWLVDEAAAALLS